MALALLLGACSQKVGEGSPDAAEVEPGTIIEMAAAARVGMTIAGRITERHQRHYFRFDNSGEKRDMIRVRLQNRSSTLNPGIYLYDHEQNQIGSKSGDAPGSHIELTVPVEAGKSIFVVVQPASTFAEGDYELSVFPLKAYDASEDNNHQGAATALQFGTPVEAGIMDYEDKDWFRVTPPASGKATIGLENLSPGLKPRVTVFFGTALPAEKHDVSPGADLSLEIDVRQGQEFHVQVDAFESSDGKYRLTASQAASAGDMAN